MADNITLRQLSTVDEAALLDHECNLSFPWYTSRDYFLKCLDENREGKRITLMAYVDSDLAGYCHLLHHSSYPYFSENQIPEINDLNVFPRFRRRKVASALFDELEAIAAKTYRCLGLGVGLYRDYGPAQIMYTTRGYVMDGNGITYKNVPVVPGQSAVVDDELLLYLIKDLAVKEEA
ncbi:GNAT family N-acetyltransferase [Paenibacillus thiaminolyticus]|uniref:GNAT family N-acetyltransferase n=1 Tax=Paenibacillus thiaminolyticus TaxID=49283 RepID=UPI0035A6B904